MPVGLLALVGTSWYGHRIATDFYNPFTPTNSRSVTWQNISLQHNYSIQYKKNATVSMCFFTGMSLGVPCMWAGVLPASPLLEGVSSVAAAQLKVQPNLHGTLPVTLLAPQAETTSRRTATRSWPVCSYYIFSTVWVFGIFVESLFF